MLIVALFKEINYDIELILLRDVLMLAIIKESFRQDNLCRYLSHSQVVNDYFLAKAKLLLLNSFNN